MDDKDKKIEKLKKVLALAEGNPNKHQAMAAIDMFHERLKEYGLTMEEVMNATKDDFAKASVYSAKRGSTRYHFVDHFLWRTLADFCGVKVNVGTDSDGDMTIIYFGLEAEVAEAVALRKTIKAAMAFEWGIFRDFVMPNMKNSGIKEEMEGFHRGFADECRDRMEDRIHAVKKETTSYALIVKKSEIVAQEAARRGFTEAVGGRGRARNYSAEAYGSGRSAGGRVNFGTSVGNGGSKMIGKH